MSPDLLFSPLALIIQLATLVLAITVHEFAHAWVADRLGDPTARLSGRVTLNPLAHLDLYGSLLFLFLLLSRAPIVFGWGKPVPFDPFNLKNPKRDGALISLAGPTSNLFLATVSAIIFHLVSFAFVGDGAAFIGYFLHSLILINVVLAIFNLIPIHPLDGFKIVGGLLPETYVDEWYDLARYGIFFLFFLILPLPGGNILMNILNPAVSLVLTILGLPF